MSWTHNLLILSRCKRDEEREFYLRLCRREQMVKPGAGAAARRRPVRADRPVAAKTVTTGEQNCTPTPPRSSRTPISSSFLDLPEHHSEADLQHGLVEKLKQFLIELGRDFCFVGSQYPLQVGGRDFAIDLLFFNRALNCLVAFELKIDEFQPEHLGKLEFYLEALDRDVKKPHERPSIGVLLCATKDHEVVEYALSRAMSPALVAEYQTRLPDKKLLQAKLHEFYELAEQQAEASADIEIVPQPVAQLPNTKLRRPAKKSKPKKDRPQ